MIYLYETVPGTEGDEVTRYEIKQSMHDMAFTHHPQTGDPIRRVIVGGMGFITGKSSNSRPAVSRPPRGGCGCGSGGCGHR